MSDGLHAFVTGHGLVVRVQRACYCLALRVDLHFGVDCPLGLAARSTVLGLLIRQKISEEKVCSSWGPVRSMRRRDVWRLPYCSRLDVTGNALQWCGCSASVSASRSARCASCRNSRTARSRAGWVFRFRALLRMLFSQGDGCIWPRKVGCRARARMPYNNEQSEPESFIKQPVANLPVFTSAVRVIGHHSIARRNIGAKLTTPVPDTLLHIVLTALLPCCLTPPRKVHIPKFLMEP